MRHGALLKCHTHLLQARHERLPAVLAELHVVKVFLQTIQGTFGEHSGNIQGTFREHSGNSECESDTAGM
eukprot:8518737-Pyramimonas_sp.AAC.1